MALPGRPVFPGTGHKKKGKKSGPSGNLFDKLIGAPTANVFDALNNQKTAGSLAEAIEKQAAAQKRAAQASNPSLSVDPFAALQQQLFGAANNISVAATPIEQLRQMAQQQVAAQFDPQIQGLMSQMASHANRAQRSEKSARQMYGALSQDYLSQLPELTAQYKAEDDATNQRYDQAQSQMNAEYQKNAGAQDAVLKQLGIQAAAPQASQQASDDQKYFQNSMEADQQNALSALAQQQMAQKDYTQNLGSNAKMAGENVAQDIGQQLRDYQDQSDAQLSQLQSGKQTAISALVAQMQQQDAQRVQQQQQQDFDNMMKLYNFQLSATKAANSANGGGGGFGSGTGLSGLTSGLQGANNYLASVYPDQPILASHLMEQLNNVLSNKDVTNGKFVLTPESGTPGSPGYQSAKYSDVGQEYMMDLLRKQFENQGSQYGTGDINATMNALLAYLGKLR